MARFNVAVVGCGGMSGAWVNVLVPREDVKIVALVDLVKENAERVKKHWNLDCPVFEKLTDALEKCSVNLVVDVTIPEAHFATVTTALKAGCDVIGEKPMAASLKEAVKMVETAEKTGKEYFVMQNRRYISPMVTMRNLTMSKELGSIGSLSADFFIGAHFGGFRDMMESPLILDMAIHTFDSARFIADTDAVSVYCHEFNPSWSWYKG
ncbi:MAG TPA: Gfo/Idh/MocA family oxidoreductase, partial [Clostridia bacterium]|nr:Gfo/Idh/MocA family oxidoreductase [Clostridia bacterium]